MFSGIRLMKLPAGMMLSLGLLFPGFVSAAPLWADHTVTDRISARPLMYDSLKNQVAKAYENGSLNSYQILSEKPLDIEVEGSRKVVECLATENAHWLQESQECEFMEETMCKKLRGKFTPCVSQCRNMPDDLACIQMCVRVCRFP